MNTQVINNGPARNLPNGVRMLLCGAVAILLTVACSWTFVAGSSVTRVRGDAPAIMYSGVPAAARHG
ncbi:MAG: hypothetical protein WCE48_02455 [Steroidobacteraceae bacterium]